MARIIFRCPHCKAGFERTVITPIVFVEGHPTIHFFSQPGICGRCGKGMRMIFCAAIEKMTEHEVRKEEGLFRLAERLRRKLRIPL